MDFDFKVVGFSLTNYGPFLETAEVPVDELFTFVIGKNNTGKSWVLRALAMKELKGHVRDGTTLTSCTLSLEARSKEDALAIIKYKASNTEYAGVHPDPRGLNTNSIDAAQRYWMFLKNNSKPFGITAKRLAPTGTPVVQMPCDAYETSGRPANAGDGKAHSAMISSIQNVFNRVRFFDFRTTNFETTEDSSDRTLQETGRNLPTALAARSQLNGNIYARYMALVTRVLPELAWITPTTSNNMAKLSARFEIPSETSDETLIPLADCGAGVGHVLAILYVAFYERNRIILIDEPQAYLHPSACRELIKVLRELRANGHQYIIATHSTAILSEGLPATVIQVERTGDSSTLRASPRSTYSEAINDLAVVGARWSDVFVSDEIVWVEGETEADCLPFIMLHFFDAVGFSFLPLRATADFRKSDPAKFAVTMHSKIASRLSLATPKCRVFLDTENLSEADQIQRKRDVGSSLEFFPFAMYEQQLFHAEAITNSIMEDSTGDSTIIRADVLAKVTEQLGDCAVDQEQNWAKRLKDVFNNVAEGRFLYDKRRHGLSMTKYLLEHDDSKFYGLRDFLSAQFGLKPIR